MTAIEAKHLINLGQNNNIQIDITPDEMHARHYVVFIEGFAYDDNRIALDDLKEGVYA